MRCLADTHAYLWWLADDASLGVKAREAMADPGNTIFISAASIWEIAIKTRLGKLDVDGDPLLEIAANGFVEMSMTGHHAQVAGALPRHHGDPFDRMLIAQAQAERLVLLTRDRIFTSYDVEICWS